MSKELEALVKLKDRADHDEYLFRQDTDREKAIKFLNENNSYVSSVEQELKERENLATMCDELAELVGLKDKDYLELKEIITKKLKALNEIVALHEKWLGNGMSDFEFFTLLGGIKVDYGLRNEVIYGKETS